MKEFLEANQKEYELAEKHIAALYDQEVSGRAFL